jgi:predicted MFS family arabinose efflux permease
MVFLLFAGVLAEIGWQYPFLIHLLAFVILLGVLFLIDEPEVTATDPTTSSKKPPFPWRKLAPVYVTAFVGMAIFVISQVQIPFYLSANNDVSSSQVGLALSLQSLFSVFFALRYQRLKARYSFFAIFSLIFLSFSLNHFVVSFSSAYIIVIAGLLTGCVGIGLLAPSSIGWLSSIAPAEIRGKAVGGMMSMVSLGQFFSPVITQPFINQVGLAATFAVAGVVALLITLLFAATAAKHKQASSSVVERNT